jgi:ribosome-associated translation inhibitor RaiA
MSIAFGTGVAPRGGMTTTPIRQSGSPILSLNVEGLPIAPSLRNRVGRQIRRALVGVQTSPIRVRVTFSDVNGPKGGVDVRCAIDVRIPRTAPLHAEALARNDVTAFDISAAVITRRIARRLLRRQESGRRPKKYYAAARLLRAGAALYDDVKR